MPWVKTHVLTLPHVEAVFRSADYYLFVVDAQMHFMDSLVWLEADRNISFLDEGYFVRVVDVELYRVVLGED